MTATGLFRRELSRNGRDAQSRAFLSCPGTEPLYSGVAIRTAPAAVMASRSARTTPGAASSSL
jgi:hypothetical protein